MNKQDDGHTPGPWVWWPNCCNYEGGAVTANNGSHLAQIVGDRNSERVKANARLISAAPEMLEALEGLTRIVEAFRYTTQLGKSQKQRFDNAKSVIAKAKGEA